MFQEILLQLLIIPSRSQWVWMGLKSKCLFPCTYGSLTGLLLPVPVQFGDAEAHREFTSTHVVQINTKAPYLFNLASLLLRTTK